MTDRKRPKKKKEANEREVLMHLRYLKDPIKLAEFVRNALRDDNYDLAVKVVHEASSSTPCIVSWNHIIEYNLNRGRMNQALKCYNDVRGRSDIHIKYPLTASIDEEESSSSGCPNLYHYIQRMFTAQGFNACPSESLENV